MNSKTDKLLAEYLNNILGDTRPVSKTKTLMAKYMTFLEQGESPPVEDPTMAQDPSMEQPPAEGAEAAPEAPVEEEPTPETSVAENEYVKELIDAALFTPSPHQQRILFALQARISNKNYNNAREDILIPHVLPMINPSGKPIEPPSDAPDPQNTVPLSPEGEDQYVSDIVDASLFEPSSEDAEALLNFQSLMGMEPRRFKNSRDEVLPHVLSIINPSTQAGDMKKDLNSLT